MSAKKFSIIVAKDQKNGIFNAKLPGKRKIPWDFSPDLKYFRKITTGNPHMEKTISRKNAIIMGRLTYESIGKVLPDRVNIVVSATLPDKIPDIIVKPDLSSALSYCAKNREIIDIFVIGGEKLYKEAAKHPLCQSIYITVFCHDFNCTGFFPVLSDNYKKDDNYSVEFPKYEHNINSAGTNIVKTETVVIPVVCEKYICVNTSELNYLSVLSELLLLPSRQNRTGVKTKSKFCVTLRYPLAKIYPAEYSGEKLIRAEQSTPILPLFTTKKISFVTVYRELLWFLSGGVDAKDLQKNNVTIWDGNSSREFLDSRGLDYYRKGELGPIYGWQWRHYGAQYIPLNTLEQLGYSSHSEHFAGENVNKGIDQIQQLIQNIKNDPYSRRHVLTAWNPEDIDKMALPPCHYTAVFYVESGIKMQKKRISREWIFVPEECPRYLNCHVTMRSNDMFLGHPFNVASYGLLTHIISAICGLDAKELCITAVDAHIYENHINAAKKQLLNVDSAYYYPELSFSPEIMKKMNHTSGNQLKPEDFNESSIEIINYHSHPYIKAEMAV